MSVLKDGFGVDEISTQKEVRIPKKSMRENAEYMMLLYFMMALATRIGP